MKKLLTLFALMLLCIGQTFAYDFEVDGIYYNKSGSDATVTYKTSDYKSYSGIVSIPATVTYGDVTYNVTTIGEDAIRDCSRLSSIIIPNSVTSIEGYAFWNCSGLTSITIPNSVTSIGDYTFHNCSGLSSIIIPNSVRSIGVAAFYGCSGLTSVTIPNSVTSIGKSLFRYCSGLISITVESGNTHYDSRNNCNAIIETASNTLIAGCKNTSIPNSVTSIVNLAFQGCSGLTTITIPNSVKEIGTFAFDDCSGLTSITILNSMTSINNYAFWNCSGLTSVANMAAVPQSISSDTFSKYSGVTLHVPEGCKAAYAAADYWKNFKIVDDINVVEFTDGTTYNNTEETLAEKLTYTRTFSNTNWQALYVPFSMEYDEWSEKYDIAEIHNFIEYDDDDNGTFDRTYLVVLKKTSGSTEPNYPYLIRAKKTGTHSLVLQNKTLVPAASTSIDCSSVKNRYTFTGTYQQVDDMYANGYYAMNGGSLQQPASASVPLNAQRWYMAVTSRTGVPSAVKAQTIRILVDGEDDVEGICEFGNSEISKSGNVGFDLTGRAVSTATSVRGITISNGKKVIR